MSLLLGWTTALGSHSPPYPDLLSIRIDSQGEVPTLGGAATITVEVRCPEEETFSEFSYTWLELSVHQSNIVFGGVFNSADGFRRVEVDCTGDWAPVEVSVPADRGSFMMGDAEVYAYAYFSACCEGGYLNDTDNDDETVTLRSRAVPLVVSTG